MADAYMNKFENKDMPSIPPPTKIVEAYGLGKCPTLVRQICDGNLDVRINALGVLCDEFKNPYSIDGCVKEGVISILADMVTDPDYVTRIRASQALYLAASDANGYAAILSDQDVVLPKIVEGVNDPSETVRENIYRCLLASTATIAGVEACVTYGVTRAFVTVLPDELDSLKPFILRTLHNIVGSERGLNEAIDSNAVGVLIDLLEPHKVTRSKFEATILADTSRTLGFLCYDGKAKKEALEKGAIPKLIEMLRSKAVGSQLKSSITIALMAITITNDGKIQVALHQGLDVIMPMLYDDNRVVVLNTLKIMANLAVFPANREIFLTDSTCAVKLKKLSKSEDALIAKHAMTTLNAVNWIP